ncbi:hypothetical protein AB0K21_42250 [Streptosporangium sp. NPDC049248]|uniref:hypothetical protein n=1 Tax=Streptosporangium sp. NPDC049248 TaxID=3155651 RepID=UPI00342459B2
MTTTSYHSRYPQLAAMAGDRPLADVHLDISFERPTYHGFRELKVRPGVIDDAAVELYGYSQCHLLGRAMHKRSGWPIALVELAEPPHRWVHVGVFTPAGRVLDIHGVRTVDQVVADHDQEHDLQVHVRHIHTLDDLFTLIGIGEEHWQAGSDETDTPPLAVELAGVFADVLLAQAELVGAVSV